MSEIDWFQNDVKPKIKHSNNWPFSMEIDENVEIAILDYDDVKPKVLHYHPVMFDGKVKRVLCTAAENLGGYCPLCAYNEQQEQSNKWKTALKQDYCYTVLDKRKDQPIRKRLRLCSLNEHKHILEVRKVAMDKFGKKGLRLVWLDVARKTSKAFKPSKIGEIGQILTDVDVSEFDAEMLEPFTVPEILEQFVSDKDEMEAIYAEYSVGKTAKKTKIRDIN